MIIKFLRESKKENGYVLVTTMIAIIFVSLIGAALLRLAYSDYINTNFHVRHKKAYYIARAGAEAVGSWIQNSDNNIDDLIADGSTIVSDEIDLGDGSYIVTLDRLGKTYTITSQGTVKDVDTSIELELKEKQGFNIDHTVFADQGLDIGDIFKGNNDYDGKVVTFGTNLEFDDENVSVDENVLGKVDIDYNLGYTYKLPDFPEEDFIENGYDIYNNDTIISSDYPNNRFDYDHLNIKKDKVTIINMGDNDFNIYLNELTLGGEINIDLRGEGKVNIYVKENLDAKGNYSVNEDGNKYDVNIYHYGNDKIHPAAKSVMNAGLYTQSTDLDFTGNSLVYGNLFVYQPAEIKFSGNGSGVENIVFAPYSNGKLTGNSDFNGAVILNSVEITGSAMIYGDPDNIGLPISTDKEFERTWSDG